MSLKGSALGSSVLRGKIKGLPSAADIINQAIVVGPNAPTFGPSLWFNTAPGGAAGGVAMLSLRDDESRSAVQVEVEDEIYGVDNATANGGATPEKYDFTVL
jgi:hypothetical protein